MDKQKVVIDNGWHENPRNNSRPERRDPYEFVFSPHWEDPDDYNRM